MAKVPSQSNINDTIKDRITALNDVVEVVVKAATSKVIKNAAKHVGDLKLYEVLVQNVFGKNGVGTALLSTAGSLEPLAKAKMPKFSVLKENIIKILTFSDYIAGINVDVKKMDSVKEKLKPITDMYVEIGKAFDVIAKVAAPKMLGVRLFMVKHNLYKIAKLGLSLNKLNAMTPVFMSAGTALKKLNILTTALSNIFTNIDKIKITPMTYIKLKLIPSVLKRTLGVVRAVSVIVNYINSVGGLKDATKLSIVFNAIESVFTSIKVISAGIFIRSKLRRISRALLLIGKITRALNKIRVNMKILKKITTLQLLFTNLGLLFLSITLVAPLTIIVIPALLILIAGIWALKLAMGVIIRVLANIAGRKAKKGMLFLLLIGGFFTALAIMFFIIATVAMPVVKSTLWILGLLGVIAMVVVLTAGLGLLLSLAAPLFIPIMVGLVMMIAIVGILVLMALALKIMQAISLDPKIIKENVKCVIDTALMIIDVIFGTDDDKDSKESDKSWIADVIDFIGGQLGTIVKAIMAVAFLAVMVVAILLILLIAVQLRLIQELELDPSKIKQNVKIVIDTAVMVVTTLFDGGDKNSKESNKSWIESVIDYIGGGLVIVIKAIMAVAFLAVMVVAILLIVLIATQLRLLQELELDVGLINKNVTTVIDTAIMVATGLFDRPDRDGQKSNKGFLSAVIDFVCPELGLIFDALMAIAFLALSILSISLVIVLANQLRLLQEIPLDPGLITANVTTVIETCQMVVDMITDRKDKPDDPSSKSWIRTLFEWIGADGLLAIIDCIMALAWLGMTVALINMVTMLANQLKMLQDIKLDKGKITKNVEAVCNTADAVSACVLGRKNPIKGSSDGPLGKVLRWLFPALAEAIDMMTKMRWVSGIMSTVGVVKQVADVLMTLLKLPDVSSVKSKVKYVCDTADSIVAMVTSRPGVDTWDDAKSRITWMERITRTVQSMGRINPMAIKRAQTALRGHIALIKQIKAVDVQKLETSARMFQQMARFSQSIKGNFEMLAETLAEDLMPILKELKEIMEKVPEKLDTGFANTSASIGAVNAPTTEENMAAQVQRESPNATKDDVDKIVNQRLAERASNDANGVIAKMEHLIGLLQGQNGTVVVHTT